MNRATIISWGVSIILLVLLLLSLFTKNPKEVVKETHTTDTLWTVKVDTVKVVDTRVVERHTVDTVYVPTQGKDTVRIPIMAYHFSKPQKYDIWAKGYNVTIDSTQFYPTTTYRTVTNEVEKIVATYKSSLFINVGFSSICGTFSPKMGVTLSLKGKWEFGAEIGLYNDKPCYGARVGMNILN